MTATAAPTPFAYQSEIVSVLDIDETLGQGVSHADKPLAELAARARLIRLPVGPWQAPDVGVGDLGLLIASGLLVRTVRIGRRETLELLGPGDLIRPGADDVPGIVPCDVAWQVLTPASVAALDARFARTAWRCPQLGAALTDRALRRARWLAMQAAIVAHPTVEERLMLFFCHLGERIGKVTPRGIALDLPFSHRLLAHGVGALRPAVTAGLLKLRDAGRLERSARRRWLITHDGLDYVAGLCEQEAIVC